MFVENSDGQPIRLRCALKPAARERLQLGNRKREGSPRLPDDHRYHFGFRHVDCRSRVACAHTSRRGRPTHESGRNGSQMSVMCVSPGASGIARKWKSGDGTLNFGLCWGSIEFAQDLVFASQPLQKRRQFHKLRLLFRFDLSLAVEDRILANLRINRSLGWRACAAREKSCKQVREEDNGTGDSFHSHSVRNFWTLRKLSCRVF